MGLVPVWMVIMILALILSASLATILAKLVYLNSNAMFVIVLCIELS